MMKIDQNYMEEEVIKPIVKKLAELESMMWVMKNNIVLLTKAKKEEEVKKEEEKKEKKEEKKVT